MQHLDLIARVLLLAAAALLMLAVLFALAVGGAGL